jgi:DNA-binding FrmR family transcriptional regulator
VWYKFDVPKTSVRKKASSLRPEHKTDVINRLKTVRGVTDGIIKMVDEDVYCVQVIKQISAARASLDRVARILLENHFSNCFVEDVKAGKTDAAVAELMETLNFHRELV